MSSLTRKKILMLNRVIPTKVCMLILEKYMKTNNVVEEMEIKLSELKKELNELESIPFGEGPRRNNILPCLTNEEMKIELEGKVSR